MFILHWIKHLMTFESGFNNEKISPTTTCTKSNKAEKELYYSVAYTVFAFQSDCTTKLQWRRTPWFSITLNSWLCDKFTLARVKEQQYCNAVLLSDLRGGYLLHFYIAMELKLGLFLVKLPLKLKLIVFLVK